MIPDFVHDIRAREPQRASLGQAVEQYLAAGGSIATLPYLAPRELTRAPEFNSSAPRVRGIAAESRSKKRAADQHTALPHGEEQCAAAQLPLIKDAPAA